MADFGKTTDGASVQSGSADRVYVSIFTCTESGTVTAAHARLSISAVGSYECKFTIWSVSAGVPVNLLAVSDEITVSETTETVKNFVFSGANADFPLVNGTDYALGLHLEDPGTPSYQISRDNNANQTQRVGDTYAGGTATTWGAGSNENGKLDVWVEYTAAGGGGGGLLMMQQMNAGV